MPKIKPNDPLLAADPDAPLPPRKRGKVRKLCVAASPETVGQLKFLSETRGERLP